MTYLYYSIYPLYFVEKVQLKMGGWEVFATALLKVPQNWVICIEKGDPNNFVQVTTILGNLY